MGRITVRDLIEFSKSEDQIVIADYDLVKAEIQVKELNNPKVSALRLDVRDRAQTVAALSGAFMVVNCIQYQLNLEVMEACLQTGAHYTDLGGLFHMSRKQLELHDKFKAANLLALIGMGAAPGITNILTRMACDQLDTVREIHTRVSGIDQSRYKNLPALSVSYSLQTILEEFSMEPAVFTKGKFTFVKPMSGDNPMSFPSPIGVTRPMNTLHSEVATLPLSFADKGVQESTFKIAFDPQFLERVRFLRDLGMASKEFVDIAGTKVRPIEVVNKVAMSQKPATLVGKLKQHEVVRAVVKGEKKKGKKSQKVTLILDCHTKGLPEWGFGTDVNTGCPPSVAALMLAAGEIKGSGVLPPEKTVDPKLFFAHLKKRKMWVTSTQKSGWDLKT